MRPIMLVMLVLGSCAAWSDVSAEPTLDARARALDGDTLSVDFRLLGVDAFERHQLCKRDNGCWSCGKSGQDLTARFVRDRMAHITLTPTSTYGRPVATVSVDGKDLGETLILAGLAIPLPQYLKQRQDLARRYQVAYATARSKRSGAFAGTWVEPAKWRQGARLACEK